MEEIENPVTDLRLVGDHLALDFANTVGWRFRERPHESLSTYRALVLWSEHAGIVTNKQTLRLLAEADHHPTSASAVLEKAIALREAIFEIFHAVARDEKPESAHLRTLNRALSDTLSRLQIAESAGGFEWKWRDKNRSLERILWPVIRSAAELLTSPQLHRVGVCAGEGCGWLFLDTSKNQSRRWCAMEDCGNRAKARRHYRHRRIRDQQAKA